jgi:AcrR family transcriptional regulator
MPKTVDHDGRRQELLEAVWRVIARDGIERTTIRTIAKETGWSSGVLAHYFTDKDDILVSALRLVHERIAARWEEKLEGLEGLAALRELVLDNLPLDDERERETRLLINYWSRRLITDGQPPEQWRRGPLLVDRLADLVLDARRLGELPDDAPAADVAERLLALIDGLSLHAVLPNSSITRERQVAFVDQELRALGSASAEGPSGSPSAPTPQGDKHA